RHPKRIQRVIPTQVLNDQEIGNHRYLPRQHHGAEHDHKTRAASGPAKAGEAVGNKGTTEDRAHDLEDDEEETGRDVATEGNVFENRVIVAADLGPPRADDTATAEFEGELDLSGCGLRRGSE